MCFPGAYVAVMAEEDGVLETPREQGAGVLPCAEQQRVIRPDVEGSGPGSCRRPPCGVDAQPTDGREQPS